MLLSTLLEFLLLILMVWVTASLAEISSTAKTKQYLGSPIKESALKNIHHSTQDDAPQPQMFEENKYANSKYEIFEVHNPYVPSMNNDENNQKSNTPTNLENPNYSSAEKTGDADQYAKPEELPTRFLLEKPDVSVSYMSFTMGNRQLIGQQQTKDAIPTPFSSHYQQVHPKKTYEKTKFIEKYPRLPTPKYFSQRVPNRPTNALHQTIQTDAYKSNANNPFNGLIYLPGQQHEPSGFQTNSALKGSIRIQSSEQSQQNSQYRGSFVPAGKIQENTVSEDSTHSELNFIKTLENPRYYSPQQLQQPPHFPPQANLKSNLPFKLPGKSQNINAKFNNLDYLPPERPEQLMEIQNNACNRLGCLPTTSNEAFEDKDYLPPYKSMSDASFNGVNFVPPVEKRTQLQEQKILSLPAGYDFEKPSNPEQAIAELHTLPEETHKLHVVVAEPDEYSTIIYETRKQEESLDYKSGKQENQATRTTNIKHNEDLEYPLPVYHFEKIANQLNTREMNSIQQLQHQEDDHTNIDIPKAENVDQVINQMPGQPNSEEANRGLTIQMNPKHESKSYQNYQAQTYRGINLYSLSQVHNQYENKQTLESTKGSNVIQGQTRPSLLFKSSDYLPSTITYKAPNYLLPGSTSRNFKVLNHVLPTTASQILKSPKQLSFSTEAHKFERTNYLPPATLKDTPSSQLSKQQTYLASQRTQLQGPDYLPPTDLKINQELSRTSSYHLRKYINNVNPSDRYGERRPLVKMAEMDGSSESSPLYREQASRSQYYAPAMSYNHNQFPQTQKKYQRIPTLSQKTRHALQNFIPKDIRQSNITPHYSTIPEALQPAMPTTREGKIRIVKVVSGNTVRTFRVLESLDDSDVRTIEILGAADKQPKGDHQAINDIKEDHEKKNINALRTFHDHHQDANDATEVTQPNLLPFRSKRNFNSLSKVKEPHRI